MNSLVFLLNLRSVVNYFLSLFTKSETRHGWYISDVTRVCTVIQFVYRYFCNSPPHSLTFKARGANFTRGCAEMFSRKYAVVLAPPAFPSVVQTLVTVSAVPRCFKYSQSQLFFFSFCQLIIEKYIIIFFKEIYIEIDFMSVGPLTHW